MTGAGGPSARRPEHRRRRQAGGPPSGAGSFGPSLKRLLGRLRAERGVVVMAVLLALSGVVMNVIGPMILGRATDIIFAGVVGRNLPAGASKAEVVASLESAGRETFAGMVAGMEIVPGAGIDIVQLAGVLALAMGFYLVSSPFLWLHGYLLNGAVQRTLYRLRQELEAKLHRLPLSYFDKMPRGELLSRVTNDIDNIAQALQQTLAQISTSLLSVIGLIAMMFVISPLLALVALVTIPASAIGTGMIARRSHKQFEAQARATGELNAQIEEAFSGHAVIKAFGRRPEVEGAFAAKNQELLAASFAAQFISNLVLPAMVLVGSLNYVIIAVLGGLRVASGTMTLGEVQAFIQYSRMFTQPLSQLAQMAGLLQSAVISFERVAEILDAPEELAEAGRESPQGRGRVAFEQVSFAYDPAKPLFDDLSLVAEPGQTVAIVGQTGAGKTTLVNLIMRFYEPVAGRITLDEIDIAHIARQDLRASIGMVLQDTWLFHGTVRDNIAYGRPSATEAEILAAAEATYVDRFVHSLPQGYDTIIEEEGGNISAGEKQLLTIARAFLADPALLILDEATSSVDTRTEVLVQRAMAALRSDRTSFVIAHRLSTIRDADLILVMEQGAIVEQGSHAALLGRRGKYYGMYNAQFADPVR